MHWLNSLLPNIPNYGFGLVFIAVLLSNIGVPLPAKTILFGAGFILGKAAGSLWQPMTAGTAACFLGGLCAFWLGRRLGHGSLEKIHWLHLTPKRMRRSERFFKQHGPKAVLIARFVPFLPPITANLLAGMTKMRTRSFLTYNLAGSAISTVIFTLAGSYFGQKWKSIEVRLGPAALYLSLAGIALLILGVIFRHSLSEWWTRRFSRKPGRERA